MPDETTVCRFRHLLEAHDLGRRLFDEVQRHLAAKGLKVATGTIVDATIINAPSSTKNAQKARDPEMHQTKKGNQWYFGMKAHVGVDSRSKLIHAVVATPANAADSTVLPDLLHGKETRVWGDQAYRGQRAVIRRHAPKAQDFRSMTASDVTIVAGIDIPFTSPCFSQSWVSTSLLDLFALSPGSSRCSARNDRVAIRRSAAFTFWSLSATLVSATILAAVRWSQDYHLFILGTLSFSAAFLDRISGRHYLPQGPLPAELTDAVRYSRIIFPWSCCPAATTHVPPATSIYCLSGLL